MGIDCSLLPIEADINDWGYSHSILDLARNYEFFDLLKDLPDAGPVPKSFTTFKGRVPDGSYEGESCYGETHTDPYGDEIRTVLAGDIAKLKKLRNYHPRIKAALLYCAQLPPDTRIALYWH